MKTFQTLSVFALLLVVQAPLYAQVYLPHVGDTIWIHEAYDAALGESLRTTALMYVPRLKEVVLTSNTVVHDSGRTRAEVVVLDYTTGALKRKQTLPCTSVYRDTVGEHGEFSVVSASMDDSGTVMCYKCYGEPWRMVSYPLLEPMELPPFDSIYSVGMFPNSRYMTVAIGTERYYRLYRYDRWTDDTVLLRYGLGQTDANASICIVNDAVVMSDGRSQYRPTLVDIATNRTIASKLGRGGYWSGALLSYDGSTLLVRTYNTSDNSMPGGSGFSTVYNARTGEKIWERENKMIETNTSGSISPDGSEIYLSDSNKCGWPPCTQYLRYVLPDTMPSAYTYLHSGETRQRVFREMLAPPSGSSDGSGYAIDIFRYRFDSPSSVLSLAPDSLPLLFPNPGAGHYTIKLPECYSELCDIQLYDAAGSLVESVTAACTNGSIPFEITTITRGMYFVWLRQHGSTVAPLVMRLSIQ